MDVRAMRHRHWVAQRGAGSVEADPWADVLAKEAAAEAAACASSVSAHVSCLSEVVTMVQQPGGADETTASSHVLCADAPGSREAPPWSHPQPARLQIPFDFTPPGAPQGHVPIPKMAWVLHGDPKGPEAMQMRTDFFRIWKNRIISQDPAAWREDDGDDEFNVYSYLVRT